MGRLFLDIFSIDRLGRGIYPKLSFIFLMLVKCSVYFFPLGDNDLSGLSVWYQNILSDPNLMYENGMIYDIPLTSGNIIYMFHVLAADFILFAGSVLYSGVYIRQYRKDHGKDTPGNSGYLIPPVYLKPISPGKLIGRLLIFLAAFLLLIIPGEFLVLFLFLIFIIIFPCICMYPACFLSGDTGFFGSFAEMVKITRGYYIINSRIMVVLFSGLMLGNILTSSLMSNLPSMAYVIGPLIEVVFGLAFGRYIGIIYCRMREIPGGGLPVRNHASSRS